MFKQINDITDVYQKSLTGLTMRGKVMSNNLANVDTPNFKRSDVSFEDQLWKSISQTKETAFPGLEINYTDSMHIPLDDYTPYVQPLVSVDKGTSYRNDGNNVDIDVEMSKLAKNEITYSAVAQILTNKLAGLKFVIADQ